MLNGCEVRCFLSIFVQNYFFINISLEIREIEFFNLRLMYRIPQILWCLIVPTVFFCLDCYGEVPTKSFQFEFDINSDKIDTNIGNNANTLSQYMAFVEKLASSGQMPVKVVVKGETSLEGTHEKNTEVSRNRAQVLVDLLQCTTEIPENKINIFAGIPWDWFRDEINRSNLPQKKGIVNIIDSDGWLMDYYAGFKRDNRIYRIRWFDKTIWNELERNYFPKMRRGIIEFYMNEESPLNFQPEVSYNKGETNNPSSPASKTLIENTISPSQSCENKNDGARVYVEKASRIIIDESGLVIIENPSAISTVSQKIISSSVTNNEVAPTNQKGENNNTETGTLENNIIEPIPTAQLAEKFNKEKNSIQKEIARDEDKGKQKYPVVLTKIKPATLGNIKTNLIGWAMGIVNAGVEFNLASHLSLDIPIYYCGWNYFKNTLKFRTLSTQPEFRYWCRSQNEGFFIGAHFGIGLFNVAWGGEYRYQEKDSKSPAFGGGVSLGYRLPISKSGKWHLEFSIGSGAYDVKYDKCKNEPQGELIESGSKTFFGIDNAGVIITYSFGKK